MTFRKLSLGWGWAEPSGHLSKVVCGQSAVTQSLSLWVPQTLGSTFCSPVRAAPLADWGVLQVPALRPLLWAPHSGEPHTWEGPAFSLRCCCHLDVLNHFLTRGPASSFYIWPHKLCSRPWMDPVGLCDCLHFFGLPLANKSQAQCVVVTRGRGCLAGQAVSPCPWRCGSDRAVRGACKDPGSAPLAFRSGARGGGLVRLFSSSLFQTSLPAGFLKPG